MQKQSHQVYIVSLGPTCHNIEGRVFVGLPWSGKNIWKKKVFPGQGNVREFCGWPGKFREDLESQGI